MRTKSKKFKIIIIILTVILTFLIVSVIKSVNKYIDTHTWATISITGTINSDTSGSFNYEHEYLKGDIIKIGNVILNITDISHDGTVSFSVQQGELYNEEGETIDADTIFKDAKSNYKLHNGFLSLNVTSNRYQ